MAKILPNTKPFEKFKVYGPYLHSKENRFMVAIVRNGDTKLLTSMQYAKYLMSVKLGRLLFDSEEVHHIDCNSLNDDLSNLELLSLAEHHKKHAKGRAMVEIECPGCKCVFTREKRQTHFVKGGTKTFCSVKCARQTQMRKRS